jgi:hypothetical protein
VDTHAEQTPVNTAGSWNRRRFLQASAVTAVGAAALAACSTKDNPDARIGTVPSTTTLPTAPVTDVALLRTSTSLEYLLLAVYDAAASQNMLGPDDVDLAAKMRDQHQANADAFADQTTELGGDLYECPNPRMMSVYIGPAMQYILGSKAAAALDIAEPATEIPPSPDIPGDTRVLLNALEVITAATHQAYVSMLNDIELRASGLAIGIGSSRRGALWGALINPDALVDDSVLAGVAVTPSADTTVVETTTTVAAPTTTAAASQDVSPPPVVHAVSSTFGQLGPVLIELGVTDDNGIRKKVNLETPYLNSLAYEYLGACPA